MTTDDSNATGPITWVLAPLEVEGLIEACRTASEVVVDLETTGLDEFAVTGGESNKGVAARIVLASFTLPQEGDDGRWDGETPVTYVLPLSHPDSPFSGSWRGTLRKVLQEGVVATKRAVNNQNVKFDARWVYGLTGVDISELIVWDTQVGSHLLDERYSTRLKERAPLVFGIPPWNDFDLTYPGAAEEVPLIELGEYACLAEGQQVITDRGLVAIEQVRLTDRLWDGLEWVHHDGVVFQGMRDIIQYAKLRATPDHLILTDTGEWACLTSIAAGTRRAASVTGEGADRSVSQPDRKHSTLPASSSRRGDVLTLSHDLLEAGQRSAARAYRMSVSVGSQVRGATVGTGLSAAVQRYGAALRNESSIRREGDRGPLRLGLGLHPLGFRGVRGARPDGVGVRSDRQQRALRARESETRDDEGQLGESPEHRQCAVHGSDGCPRSSVGPREDGPTGLSAQEGRTGAAAAAGVDGGAGDQRAVQTRVYDILNAGPRYRFAVPGLIVSNCRDTWWTWRLAQYQRQEMFIRGGGYPEPINDPEPPQTAEDYLTARLGQVASWVAMPTVASLTKMEQNGFRLDIDWARSRLDEEVSKRESGLDKMAEKYGQPRESASSAATSNWFKSFTSRAVEDDDLRVGAMTAGGSPQWNKAVLGRQARAGNEVAQLILDQRAATKLAEFLTSWLQFVRSDGKIHARYNVGKTVTGRLSASEPNMQQVTKILRPAFIPDEGYVLADFDFSQIELRVAAFVARCQPMIDAFNDGQDLHRLLGSYITKKPPEEVTPYERQKAKSANFGLLYMQSPEGYRTYAEDVYGVILTQQEAAQFHAGFFERWDGMKQWHEQSTKRIMADGYIVSPIGRVRRLPNIWSPVSALREEAARQGVNSPVQGLASDLMQMAAADIQGLLPGTKPVPNSRLVATVHDSIVAQLPADNWREPAAEIARRMERSGEWLKRLGVTFDVPIVADYSVGTRWSLDDVSNPVSQL